MLEKQEIEIADIEQCLLSFYQLKLKEIEFLPLGADFSTAVYRAVAQDNKPYFVKLRTGNFQTTSILLLDFFHEKGISRVIPPLRTVHNEPWVQQKDFVLTVFPFVDGVNGVKKPLSTAQFYEFGKMIKGIHSLPLPAKLRNSIKVDTFSSTFSKQLYSILQNRSQTMNTELAAALMGFLLQHQQRLFTVLERTEDLHQKIINHPYKQVVCHADMHAYNLLVTENEAFYLTDWDETILAPKERDLMFINSGIEGDNPDTEEQQTAFYAGYQPDKINMEILAYYRYARIIEDIVLYCEEIFSAVSTPVDLQQSFRYLQSNFTENSTLDKADEAYRQI